MKEQLTQSLKDILGNAAFNGIDDMQVPKDVSKLCHAINYLNTQIGFIVQYEDIEDRKEHAKKVRESLIEILK